MYEHGKVKVVIPEHGGDMLQMRTNFIARSIIMFRLDVHFNDAPVRQEQKVMICRRVGKPHSLIAAAIDTGSMRIVFLVVVVLRARHV